MKYLYATVALLCSISVAAKFRIDGGEEANFNDWPFVCYIEYKSHGSIVTDPSTGVSKVVRPNGTYGVRGTCVLIKFHQKFYILTAAHMLSPHPPNFTEEFITANMQITRNYAAYMVGFFTIDFGSAQKRTLSRSIITVDRNNVKIPLQFVERLGDMFNHAWAYDFLLIEINNHQWYEQRNAKFLDILQFSYNGSETLLQCKVAGWGNKNVSQLQQAYGHMFAKDRCKYYFDQWADQYLGCVHVSFEGNPICYDNSPDIHTRFGDSGSPIMCVSGRQTLLVAIHVAVLPIPVGGMNLTIRVGAPSTSLLEFLRMIYD